MNVMEISCYTSKSRALHLRIQHYPLFIYFFVVLLCIQLKLQLSECQNQLDSAQKEARAHKEELTQVTFLITWLFLSTVTTCTFSCSSPVDPRSSPPNQPGEFSAT